MTSPVAGLSISQWDRHAVLVLGIVGTMSIILAATAALIGWYLTLLPLMLIVCIWIALHPLSGIYLLLLAMQFKVSLPGTTGIYPADILSVLVITSCTVHLMVLGHRPFRHKQVNLAVFLILFVFAASLIGAYRPSIGLINLGRHIQLFALMLVIAAYVTPQSIPGIHRGFLILVGTTSVINIAVAISGGGSERIFGPAGAFFAVYAVVCSIHAAIRFILVRNFRLRLAWAAVLLAITGGLVFTQTRAAWIQLLMSLVFLLGCLFWWSRRTGHRSIRRRLAIIVVIFTLLALIMATGTLSIFQRSEARISEVVEGHATTVGYRLFLWKLGLRAFVEHPITGVGLAQISEWHNFMPTWRFYFNAITVHGLGAHNDFITYLAETGLPGTVLILVLFWLLFRVGSSRFRECRNVEQVSRLLVVWIPVTGLIIGYFFSTHIFYSNSGLLTAVYFGLLLAHCMPPQGRLSQTPARVSAT